MELERIARYVAIITDGNGRWAARRGKPPWEGHRAGAATLRARLRDAAEIGIKELTIFAFSTENWSRSDQEVAALMELMALYLERETPSLREEGVRIRFLGRRAEPVPVAVIDRIERAERATAANTTMTFYISFNYGGRQEIVDAAARFSGATEAEFRELLYAPEMHDPEVVIRTGGERRLSNFLLWQIAHARLVVREEMWPDFDREALQASVRLEGGCENG